MERPANPRRALPVLALAAALAAPVAALAAEGVCPPVPDRSAEVQALYARLRAAPNLTAARPLSDALWRIWTAAPDAAAQALLDRGMSRREAYDYAAAAEAFDALIAYCPDYAEGWNQRAFVNFLRGRHAEALDDLERALELNPDHAAALSGLALTLMSLGRIEAGQAALRAALALNPWLPERGYLIEPPGEEL